MSGLTKNVLDLLLLTLLNFILFYFVNIHCYFPSTSNLMTNEPSAEFRNRRKLKAPAVPTIFDDYPIHLQPKPEKICPLPKQILEEK
jgi:hypothetical protein